MDQIDVSVPAILVTEACNVGLTPVVKDGHPALTRGRLTHVDQNYVHADTLSAANSRLVQAQSAFGLAQRGVPVCWRQLVECGSGCRWLLLELDGGQRPEIVATDTASYSVQILGLFTLLGYKLSRRLAGLPGCRINGSGALTPQRTTAE